MSKSKAHAPGRIWHILVAVIVIAAAGGIVGLRVWYDQNLRPVSTSSTAQYFTVSPGSSAQQIARNLQSAGLIRNAKAFVAYINTKEYRDRLQAGTYSLSPSMSGQQIVQKMVTGDVAKNLLTILPGKHLDEVKQAFMNSGYSSSDVDAAFNPDNYSSTLSSIDGYPSGASLEGLLYPDSFQKQTDTPAATIVQESLDEMVKHLNSGVLAGFKAQGLSTYQAIVLASIVAQEADDPTSQPTVAQVFLLRLKQSMPLQSNVTANYAADLAGVARNVNIDSPYNTYLHTGLPPGPIGTVTVSALAAVSNPSNTDYLYFVAGDNGTIHFSHTEQEHEAAIKQYCTKLCQ